MMMLESAARIAGAGGLMALLLALPACDSIRDPLDALGARIPPPDEFQVIAHKPLIIPVSDALPRPTPGAPSPLDPDPHRDAVNALLGAGGHSVASLDEPSAGERVLLSSANAAAAGSDIRVQLEADKIEEEKNKPYEAPSLGELLFGGGDKLDETELLDPLAEAQRLQRKGQTTPVDPNAEAEVEEEEREPVTPTYGTGRPQNRVIFEGTGPAF